MQQPKLRVRGPSTAAWSLQTGAAVALVLSLGLACAPAEEAVIQGPYQGLVGYQGQPEEEKIQVPPPEYPEDVFPCTDCHDPELPIGRKRRPLKNAHKEIVLRHDEEHRWCLDCHSPEDRDKLRLASGELIEFGESYRLCGQCHGDRYRDWRAGVHGRRSGKWDGHKTYLLCVTCHNSHAPAFEPIEPMPPPRRPEEMVR